MPAQTVYIHTFARLTNLPHNILTTRDVQGALSTAKLIAAAPELYEALKFLDTADGIQDDGTPSVEAWKRIHAAIRKAEGDTNE